MASNPLFIIPDFFCNFPMNFAMATLGLKKNAKKNLVFHFGVGNFPISFKPKVAIAKFVWKMQKKSLVL